MNIHKNLLLLSASLLLVACDTSDNNTEEDVKEDTKGAHVQEESNTGGNEVENADELENVGEYHYADEAKYTLVDIISPKDEITLYDSVSIEALEIKIIEIDEIDEEYKDAYDLMNIENKDHIIRIVYNVINDTEERVNGINMATVLTSTGEELEGLDTMPLGSHDVSANEEAEAGFMDKIEDIEIDSLKLIFDLYNEDGQDLEEKPKTIEVGF